jgi:HAD superfamily hydrolase (TIGR01509 family)
MIKAIIFDCFGVLATDWQLPFIQKHLAGNNGLTDEAYYLSARVDAGLLRYSDMIRRYAKMAGVAESEVRGQIEHTVPNKQLFDYITAQLKPHYKIGLLSNAGDNWLNDLFTPRQIAVFDVIGLSYEIGVAKPQREAFTTVATRLGVDQSECVFVDDQAGYCNGAELAGMHPIQYKDFGQFQADLLALL